MVVSSGGSLSNHCVFTRLFVIFVLQEGITDFAFPLILFALAAILGFYVFYRDQFGDQQNIALAIGHAILAIGGLMMLLFYLIAQ